MSTEHPRDTGLQPERTALAWSRTAMVMGINALLILRDGLTPAGSALAIASASALASAALLFYLIGLSRKRALQRWAFNAAAPWMLMLASACTVIASLLGLYAMA